MCDQLHCRDRRVQQAHQAALWGLLGTKETRATGAQQAHRRVVKGRQQSNAETVPKQRLCVKQTVQNSGSCCVRYDVSTNMCEEWYTV
jgi:hypothetical protein